MFNKMNEIFIFRQYNRTGVSRLLEDFWVLRIAKSEVANKEALDPAIFADPPRESRRKLSIQPDDHATRIGLLTRLLAKRRQP